MNVYIRDYLGNLRHSQRWCSNIPTKITFLTAHKIRHANNTQTVCHAAQLQCWSAVRLGRHIYTATSDPGPGPWEQAGAHCATLPPCHAPQPGVNRDTASIDHNSNYVPMKYFTCRCVLVICIVYWFVVYCMVCTMMCAAPCV